MLKNLFNKFMKEEEGNVVEYIIVLAVIAVIIALAFPGLRTSLLNYFDDMLGDLGEGINGGDNPEIGNINEGRR